MDMRLKIKYDFFVLIVFAIVYYSVWTAGIRTVDLRRLRVSGLGKCARLDNRWQQCRNDSSSSALSIFQHSGNAFTSNFVKYYQRHYYCFMYIVHVQLTYMLIER